MQTYCKHFHDVCAMQDHHESLDDYNQKRKQLHNDLTCTDRQFKKIRVDAKVQLLKDKYLTEMPPNAL